MLESLAQLVPILDSILFYANGKICAIYLKILLAGVCLSGEATPSHLYQDKHTPGSQNIKNFLNMFISKISLNFDTESYILCYNYICNIVI